MKKTLVNYLAVAGIVAATITGHPYKTQARTPRNFQELLVTMHTGHNSRRNQSGIENTVNRTRTHPTKRKTHSDIILPPNMYGEIPKEITSRYNGKNEAHCAGYAFTIANSLYNKHMIITDAWNASYKNRVVTKIKNTKHLKKLILNRVITPGMIIASYYPESEYNNVKDKMGHKARYTHLAVFAGTNKKREVILLQNIYGEETKISLKNFTKSFIPIEVIDEKAS